MHPRFFAAAGSSADPHFEIRIRLPIGRGLVVGARLPQQILLQEVANGARRYRFGIGTVHLQDSIIELPAGGRLRRYGPNTLLLREFLRGHDAVAFLHGGLLSASGAHSLPGAYHNTQNQRAQGNPSR